MNSENCTTRVKGALIRQLDREIRATQFFHTHCGMGFVERDIAGERLVRFEEKHSATYRKPQNTRGDWSWRPVARGRYRATSTP